MARQARHSEELPHHRNHSRNNLSRRFNNLNHPSSSLHLNSSPRLNHNNLRLSPSCGTDAGLIQAALWQRLEHDEWLVGSWHHGFGNSNQLFLLVEDTKTRRHRRPAIEFGCRARRRLDAPRLQL